MDTTKQLAKAVINKDFAQAKDLVFKSLYARASLALDEARYTVAQSIYNSTTEVNESWGGGFETSREAWAKHMKQERLEAKRAREAKKAKEKAAAKAKKAVKEETEQLDEKKMKVWSPRLDKLMKNRDKIYVKPPAWLKRQKQREQVKEETEQIDEISKATKDSYVAKRGSQMSSMMRGPEKNYASMTGKKQANAVKGIKRAMGVKEETEQLDEVMTRKHFQQVADVIKAHPDAKKREELAAHHSQIFKKSNPRFDEGRFRKACGIGGCKEGVEVGGEQLDEVSLDLATKAYAEREKRQRKINAEKGEGSPEASANSAKAFKTYKHIKKRHGKEGLEKAYTAAMNVKEEADQLDEVSPPGMEKMTGSPRTKASFTKQYGKRGKSVMYATAWKLHNKKKD